MVAKIAKAQLVPADAVEPQQLRRITGHPCCICCLQSMIESIERRAVLAIIKRAICQQHITERQGLACAGGFVIADRTRQCAKHARGGSAGLKVRENNTAPRRPISKAMMLRDGAAGHRQRHRRFP